jgi:hypothetical protein
LQEYTQMTYNDKNPLQRSYLVLSPLTCLNDDAVEPKIQAANKSQQEVQEEKILHEQKRSKVDRNLHQLENSFNPKAARIVERIEQGKEILLDHANFEIVDGDVADKEPTTFDEAWDHKYPKSQEKSRVASVY